MADDDVRPEVREARETMLDAFARTADIWGGKRSTGRLFGVLYFADEPLSLDTLAARSEYAKSTVSTAMSTLERYHMVHRRSMPGEGKKAYFEAETDFWRVTQAFLSNEVRREIHTMSRALDDAIAALDGVDSERADRDREKLQSLKRLYDRTERAVDVLTSTSAERVFGLLDRL